MKGFTFTFIQLLLNTLKLRSEIVSNLVFYAQSTIMWSQCILEQLQKKKKKKKNQN